MTFRVGRHLGRTVYQVVGDGPSERDRLIGMMDTPEIGAYVVEALNTYERVLAAREKAGVNAPTGEQRRVIPPDQVARAAAGRHLAVVPPPRQICERTTWHDCDVTGNWSRH